MFGNGFAKKEEHLIRVRYNSLASLYSLSLTDGTIVFVTGAELHHAVVGMMFQDDRCDMRMTYKKRNIFKLL